MQLVLNELKDLKEGRENIKREIEALKISNQELRREIKSNCSKMEDNINLKISNTTDSVNMLQEKVTQVEKTISEPKSYDPDVTLVVTGIPHIDGEDPLAIGSSLLKDMGLEHLPIIRAKRQGANEGKQGVLKLQMATLEDKISVLRSKGELKNSRTFKKAFVRTSKTHGDRLNEINCRKLLAAIPGASDMYYMTSHGKIMDRNPDRQPHNMSFRGDGRGRGYGRGYRGRGYGGRGYGGRGYGGGASAREEDTEQGTEDGY
jgi:hypothetical protein